MGHCLCNTNMDMIIHIHIRLTDTNNSIVQCNNKSILSVIAATLDLFGFNLQCRSCFVLFDQINYSNNLPTFKRPIPFTQSKALTLTARVSTFKPLTCSLFSFKNYLKVKAVGLFEWCVPQTNTSMYRKCMAPPFSCRCTSILE